MLAHRLPYRLRPRRVLRRFRRLGRKTQVHPLAEHDLTHNRLTHSVEVASVGRSIGNRVGVMLQGRRLLPENNTPSDIGAVVPSPALRTT